jgi:peroxisomal enoyl-CoA hydratase 2
MACPFATTRCAGQQLPPGHPPVASYVAAGEKKLVETAPFITGEWGEPQTVSFNQRDLELYAVGIGCTEMKFIYEQDPGFEPFPTYPVLLDMKGDTADVDTAASSNMYLGKLAAPPPGSPKKRQPRPKLPGVKVGVDAERYIERIKALPTSGGTFQIRSRLLGIHKKGSGALTETESELFDPETGEVYYKFVGAGFGIGARDFVDGGKNFSQTVKPPQRQPDSVVEEHVADNQAHIYRLSVRSANHYHEPAVFPVRFYASAKHGMRS